MALPIDSPSPFQWGSSETRTGFGRALFRLGSGILEQILKLTDCRSLYAEVTARSPGEDFPAAVLELLEIEPRVTPADLDRVPARGASIVVANHPFGAAEGLVLAALLRRLRPDVKFLANYLLQRIPEMGELVIPVDPFGGPGAARRNLGPTLESLRWLKKGGLLVVFPAGEVSHWLFGRREIADPPWNNSLARLVRASGAPVVPVFFPGRNGLLFQLAGLVHPRLRTALLPRQLLNKRGRSLPLRIGIPIPASRLRSFGSDREMAEYLRFRTYMLGHAVQAANPPRETVASAQEPVMAALGPETLEREVALLSDRQLLASGGDLQVWLAEAWQIPHLLEEIGRLREIAFRQAGEGTGRAVDLDRFDQHYLHLFLWNRKRREIAGAYRCGQCDQILKRFGVEGLYTSTLFRYGPELLKQIGPALELGRSFVRPEYQKSYAPLLLLWKGIGQFLVRHPRYRTLFGPVSITRDYSDFSRQLMAESLWRSLLIPELARLVRPRFPLHQKPLRIKGCDHGTATAALGDIEEVSALVANLEMDRKGIPVLLRQYLNLGGRLLSFNVDPEFGEVLDGLILVDLSRTERKTLERYMTREGAASFLNPLGDAVAEWGRRCA
ncbi:MAG: lysophospholipid acyltransferase family protein [Deltaproteobacteria bacterium]|nr:lysophospholipid acyltransferase family protein [Deltaproteobacteria bacterium]